MLASDLVIKVNGVPVRDFNFSYELWSSCIDIELTVTDDSPLFPPLTEVFFRGQQAAIKSMEWEISWDHLKLVKLCLTVAIPRPPAFGFGEAKTFPGSLRGYRYFRLYSNLNLHSVSHRDAWDDREKVAQCAGYTGIHTAPQPRCRCGIYGWYAPELATENHGNFSLGLGHGIRDRLVLGAVSVSGNIVPGTDGFRAERAKIEALVLPGNFHYFAGREKEFQERYSGIQVFNHLDDLVEAFSPSDVSELMS